MNSMPHNYGNRRKILFFTDFDGTITTEDSNDALVSALGYGETKLNQSNLDVLEGRTTLRYHPVSFGDASQRRLTAPRSAFAEQMSSIRSSLQTCITWQQDHITLDPHFAAFHTWAKNHDISVTILSGGLQPFIRALLEKSLGAESRDIPVFASDISFLPGADADTEGGWKVEFFDDSAIGMDKGRFMREPVKELEETPEDGRPIVVFAGDGVSDLSAAREADVLFAKKGRDLVTYCEREGIAYREFEDWRDILGMPIEI